jgi:hypothetical protein
MEDQALSIELTRRFANDDEVQNMSKVVTEALAAHGVTVTRLEETWNSVAGAGEPENLELFVFARDGFDVDTWPEIALAAANALEKIGITARSASRAVLERGPKADADEDHSSSMWSMSEHIGFGPGDEG